MADLNDPLPGSGVHFWTMAAALAGSLLSLRTVAESGPTARMFAVGSAWMLSFFLTPAIAEYWGIGIKGERAISLLIAFAGVNLLAGLAVFAQKFRDSPASAIEWLISLWRGNKP